MTYQANIFYLGQQFRKNVIQTLAAQHVVFHLLPQAVDAGEIVRKSFYDGDSVERCAALIETARKANLADRSRAKQQNEVFETALAAIMAALYPNGLQGWEDWNAYAASGEWQ